MTSLSPADNRDPDRHVRVLLLSYYFPPDQTPGAFRSMALFEALRSASPSDGDHRLIIDVVTTQPNRYRASQVAACEEQVDSNSCIYRLPVTRSGPGYLGHTRAFLSFARQVNTLVSNKLYDLVVATTSRQMTGVLGASIAHRKRIPLYLDVRDLFAHNIGTMFSWPFWPISGLLRLSERWMLSRATKVSAVSAGFLPYLGARLTQDKLSFFPNGVDELFAYSKAGKTNDQRGSTIEIVYAGNVGAGQSLHLIVPDLASRLRGHARFTVLGDGQQIDLLRSAVAQNRLSNVAILGQVSRERLPEVYAKADVLFLHLGAAASLNVVLPSKLFEYAASGKPILAGVRGYAADFIREEVENAAVFPPCDVEAAVEGFRALRLSLSDRSSFTARYARGAIMRQMARDILSIARQTR